MADTSAQLERLRARVSRFLGPTTSRRRVLREFLRGIRDSSTAVFLFGGTLRDLMVGGARALPRDIDLVIAGVQTEDLEHTFGAHVRRRTRFGGLHLNVGGWLVDIWPLRETWAFRERCVETGFSTLPRTTFLNVEAAAAELGPRRGRERLVHSHGFFEGILDRVVEINLEENPFPTLCVLRGLVTAARLRFRVGPRLARYVAHYSCRTTIEELVSVQWSHYGSLQASTQELQTWITTLCEHARSGARCPIPLPVARPRQLQLWADAPASR